MTEYPNCEDRLPMQYAYEEERILKVTGIIEPDDEWLEDEGLSREDRIGTFLNEHILSFQKCFSDTPRGIEIPRGCYARDMELSTGGPGDGFIILYDKSNNSYAGAYYYFQDWFDGANKEVPWGSDLAKGLEMLSY